MQQRIYCFCNSVKAVQFHYIGLKTGNVHGPKETLKIIEKKDAQNDKDFYFFMLAY